jgi:hypothetical protein
MKNATFKLERIMKALLTLTLLTLGFIPARGGIPEPDNVVYGQIWIGTNLLTSQRTNFVVEVRHSGDTAPLSTNLLASYRMGQESSLSNYYAVTIPLTLQDTFTPMIGSNLVIRVTGKTVTGSVTNLLAWYTTNFTAGPRGYVVRMDLRSGSTTNAPSGYEAWAATYGLGSGSANLDADADGMSNFAEYVAGTKPDNSADKFTLRISETGVNPRVSFDAVRAAGTGYEGRTRHYALEWLADVASSTWEAVPDRSDIVGADQVVDYDTVSTNASSFFRARVWLDPAP